MTAEKIYLKPETTDEAIAATRAHENDFCYVAGGTDVFVNKFQGNKAFGRLIDLSEIEELKQIATVDKHLKIGSLVRLDDLKNNEDLLIHFPSLIKAAGEVASPTLRKTATIGGNILCENRCSYYNQSEWWREAAGLCLKCGGDICIATGGKNACFSKFVSDTAPVLISACAQLEIADHDGVSTVDLQSIYTGDGVKPRNISSSAIIKNIVLPIDKELKIVFKKLRPREAVDFTSLTTAVSLNKSGMLKIVIGGVDPKPIVVEGMFGVNHDDLIKQALKKSRMVNNDYYSRSYRREIMRIYLENSFKELAM
jgi:4-hydroxybenzoyl-CoA reductase subunit beta